VCKREGVVLEIECVKQGDRVNSAETRNDRT
jgi:hypothetical protein